jgi:hypothetical protein
MSYINKALTARKSDLVAARAGVRDAVASCGSTGLGEGSHQTGECSFATVG